MAEVFRFFFSLSQEREPTCVDGGIFSPRPAAFRERNSRRGEMRRRSPCAHTYPTLRDAEVQFFGVWLPDLIWHWYRLTAICGRADHAAGLCCFECQENGSLVLQRAGMHLCYIVPCASEVIGLSRLLRAAVAAQFYLPMDRGRSVFRKIKPTRQWIFYCFF